MHRLLALLVGCLIATGILAGAFFWSLDGETPFGPAPQEGMSRLDPRFGNAAEQEIEQRLLAIHAEVARTAPEHPWAGTYYEGDGLGANVSLSLAPISGFAFEWHGCMGLYDRNFGLVEEYPDRLEFQFQFPNDRSGFQGLDPVVVPVCWGERHYLIPQTQLEEFCRDVNKGWEPRAEVHGFYLLREGDEEKPAPGLPSVPPEVRPLLLEAPIEASVIRVGESWQKDEHYIATRLTLDKGAKEGIAKDMWMRLLNPDQHCIVRIDEVETDSCSGVMTTPMRYYVPPEIGWRFSSKVYGP